MNSSSAISRFLRDCIDLIELQIQLVSVDAQATKGSLQRAAVLIGIAVAVGGSTLTLGMVTCGLLVSEFSSLSLGMSMLIVTLVGGTVVAAALALAASCLTSAVSATKETKRELAENYRWLKATLIQPSTSPRSVLRRESFPSDDDPTDPVSPRWAEFHPAKTSEFTLPKR